MKESGERDEGPNCSTSLRGGRSTKEPETLPAERVLKITPVCKEPPAAREQGPREQRKNPGRVSLKIELQYRSVPTCRKQDKSPSLTSTIPGGVRVLYVKYNRPRNRSRALRGERRCYRRHRSKEGRNGRQQRDNFTTSLCS